MKDIVNLICFIIHVLFEFFIILFIMAFLKMFFAFIFLAIMRFLSI